ncbi:uncharacterized protein L3040_000480 [Drepanopeziza brunnea f. sp. 'multigermtubi']|nr:hypothetical protein L3040_000480 [Drepanopeziza brunnea f. sp. 'multigermtubi']
MSVDVSSLTGPPQNEQQLKEVNRQEAAGILTGGLGAGWKPVTTIKSTDLYANQPATPRTPASMSRMLSFRRPSLSRDKGLARTQTVRELGQIEANKRGEIIKVIVEEPTFDISSFAGDSSAAVNFESMNGATTRKNTLHVPHVEVFYPQDNWKPVSMRWSYITALIVISISLAVVQEVVLQKGAIYTFVSASKLSTWNYFTFKYLPTLVAVSFGVLWQVTDFEVKRLEAYYQLSRQGGALAAESINVDYITFFNFLRPIRALKFKHYAVAVSSQATLMAVSLVPTLQAASIELRPTSRAAPGSEFADEKQIAVNAILSRILSAVLVTIAVLGSILVWQLGTRPSGLVADVKGIAGIAAMANRSHILMDFKNMDTATPEMIHQTLKSHRYSLRNSSLAPEDKVPLTQAEKDRYDQQTRHGNPHPLMLRLVAGIPFITVMILFIALVPIVLFVPALAEVTTRAPWFLTALAVGIKLAWGTLETDVRMMEPFYILSKRHASPRVLTLDYTAVAFGWMPIRAFVNGHLLVGLVGLGSVLAEILTVCSSSFAGVHGREFFAPSTPSYSSAQASSPSSQAQRAESSGEETFLSFWLSFGLALLILAYLCCVAALVYVRRRHIFLPRQPSTIASVLAFIHQSKMLNDFVGTEKMNNDEMVERLARVGKTYGLGWFTGRDGEMHCGVDEEELVSAYKHGRDERKAIQPWSTQWENY